MLKLGSSRKWTEALEAITGSTNITAAPLIEYFQPLMTFLTDYNKKNGHSADTWTEECPTDLPKVPYCTQVL